MESWPSATFPQALENPRRVSHSHPPSTTILLLFHCTFLIVVTAQRGLTPSTPQGPISSAGQIVRKHLLRAKITAPSYGAHLLRHSLATRMVNQGAAIKQIADVLGHQSINTTAIYTKVDTNHLAEVALPFPGSAS